MAATVAAPLPLSMELVEALKRRGIKRAAHVEGVFGGDRAHGPGLRARVREVLGDELRAEQTEEWALELEDFLPAARDQARGDADRIARVDGITRADAVRRQRARDEVERPYPLVAAASELAWAPPPVKRWRTQRVARRAASGEEPDARKRAEQEEHKKWATQAAQILLDVDAPVVNDGAGGRRSVNQLLPLLSRRRASTVRARVRVYGKLLSWVQRRRPGGGTGAAPMTTMDVLSYLNDAEEAHGGTTVPRAVIYAISFFERIGGMQGERRLTNDPLVAATAEAVEDGLVRGRGPRGETLRIPFIMSVALELYVVDKNNLLYKRFLAGYVLLKTWACLRYDDTRGGSAAPHSSTGQIL